MLVLYQSKAMPADNNHAFQEGLVRRIFRTVVSNAVQVFRSTHIQVANLNTCSASYVGGKVVLNRVSQRIEANRNVLSLNKGLSTDAVVDRYEKSLLHSVKKGLHSAVNDSGVQWVFEPQDAQAAVASLSKISQTDVQHIVNAFISVFVSVQNLVVNDAEDLCFENNVMEESMVNIMVESDLGQPLYNAFSSSGIGMAVSKCKAWDTAIYKPMPVWQQTYVRIYVTTCVLCLLLLIMVGVRKEKSLVVILNSIVAVLLLGLIFPIYSSTSARVDPGSFYTTPVHPSVDTKSTVFDCLQLTSTIPLVMSWDDAQRIIVEKGTQVDAFLYSSDSSTLVLFSGDAAGCAFVPTSFVPPTGSNINYAGFRYRRSYAMQQTWTLFIIGVCLSIAVGTVVANWV